MAKKELIAFIAGGIAGVVLAIPVAVWGNLLEWQLGQVTLYAFFPLLGLLAFSMMWLQIVAVGLEDYLKKAGLPVDDFLLRSGMAVLALIIFHPLLLGIAQWQQGLGLPLESLYAYPAPKLQILITYAIIGWSIFMISEVTSNLANNTLVKKYAKVIEYANYGGFYLVFWHGLNLGTHLQGGLLRPLWWFYGISSMFLLGYKIMKDRGSKVQQGSAEADPTVR